MNLKTTLLFILISGFVFGQSDNFEGVVSYKLIAKNPNPELVSDSIWNLKVGNSVSHHKYFYKGSCYKNIIDNKEVQIYRPETNIIYNYKIGKDTIFSNTINADKSIDPIKSIERSDEIEFIQGYECHKIIIKSKFAETSYFYSNKLKVSPDNYINHNYGNWFDYLMETNALPLKIIVKNKFLHMEMTADNLDIKELSISVFELPKEEH